MPRRASYPHLRKRPALQNRFGASGRSPSGPRANFAPLQLCSSFRPALGSPTSARYFHHGRLGFSPTRCLPRPSPRPAEKRIGNCSPTALTRSSSRGGGARWGIAGPAGIVAFPFFPRRSVRVSVGLDMSENAPRAGQRPGVRRSAVRARRPRLGGGSSPAHGLRRRPSAFACSRTDLFRGADRSWHGGPTPGARPGGDRVPTTALAPGKTPPLVSLRPKSR